MISFPTAIQSFTCEWVSNQGIFAIYFKLYSQRGPVRVTATADRLPQTLRNAILYFEDGNLLLPGIPVRKLSARRKR